ncbi:TRF2-interacting telomeric protein/Rap1 C terminal domain-containing protein [Trichoderma barbatum]
MASHITYDGVPGAGTGGNIFNGMKFWVSRRVPQRESLLEKIQSNSGVVVILEKDADMLIADHARKDAPLGSYSWKFITESVNAGIIQVEDKYLIGPPPNQRRSVHTGAHAKKTRTPFSEQDDAVVAKWVLKYGINTAGNKMYMDLEDEYPHHPWQSWRNRWVKVLSLRSNEEIDRLARLANVDVDNASITAKHIIRKHQREDWPHAPQNDTAISTSAGNSQTHNRPSPRAPRSEESRRREVTSSDRNRRNTTDDAVSEPDGDSNEDDTTINHDAAVGNGSAAAKEIETSKEREEKQKSRQKEGAGVEQGGGELGEEIEVNAEEDTQNDDNEDEVSVDGGLSSFSEREQFLSDLQDYCEANDKRLDMRCVIGNNEIDLWELFRAVSAQALPPDELDWRLVAEHLGLDWAQNNEVMAALLKSSYDRHLADFVEAMMSFEANEEDPDEDMTEDEDTALGDEEATAQSATPQASQGGSIASSLPNDSGSTISRKRETDEPFLTPIKRSKRRRTIHSEIPMTPEDKQTTGRRLSAPASAPGNLQSMGGQGQTEVDDPRQRASWRNQRRQQSPDEPDMTPSQQLRSETDSIASPEPIEPGTPTLYFSPTATSYPHRNDRQLETIQEEDSATSTPTKSRSRKRELPASFQPLHKQLEERREKRRQLEQELRQRQHQRQQQQLEEHTQEELRQEDRRQEEQRQQEQQRREQELGEDQQQRWRRWHQDAADSSESDEENAQKGEEQFFTWKARYLSQGFSEEMIIEAMRRTTMTPGEAMDAVLASLRDGEGIPSNHEGIWTDRDDARLKYVIRVGNLELSPQDDGDVRRRKEKAQKMLDRLLYKHEEPRVKLRRKFHKAVAVAERDRRRQSERGGH